MASKKNKSKKQALDPIVALGKFKITNRNRGSFSLGKTSTEIDKIFDSDDDEDRAIADITDEISDIQKKLYADSRHGVLIILQGMDTSGKDSLIRHVFSGINPQGIEVTSFGAPSSDDLKHDFMWRTNKKIPQRGKIGVFNRSYYEEVSVVRVREDLLAKQNLPPRIRKSKSLWTDRFEAIRAHESYLEKQGYSVLKFFLNISRKEQKERLLKRIENKQKHWKIDLSDFTERKRWPAYKKAWSECIKNTSTNECPWHVIPADHKPTARYIVGQIILEELRRLALHYPPIPAAREKEILKAAKDL